MTIDFDVMAREREGGASTGTGKGSRLNSLILPISDAGRRWSTDLLRRE
jgi:hypothetical protein